MNEGVQAVYDELLEVLVQDNATGTINVTAYEQGVAVIDEYLDESLTAVNFILNPNQNLCQDLFLAVRIALPLLPFCHFAFTVVRRGRISPRVYLCEH